MKYVKLTYEELKEQNDLYKRKINNLKHYQKLIQADAVTNSRKIARDLDIILQGL